MPGKSPSTPKSCKAKVRKPKARKPTIAEMVDQAVGSKARGGMTFNAIIKYIAVTFEVGTQALARHIGRYLEIAVKTGKMEQTRGTGLRGKFALPKPQETKLTAKPKKKKKTTKVN